MANNRTIEVIVRAKDAMAAGLKSAGAALAKFGRGVADVSRQAAKALLAVGATAVAIGAKAVGSYFEQERATVAMRSALAAHGEEVDANMRALQDIASAIQDETAVGDELTLSRMARMKMLGMETSELGNAAKAVIALTNAGMGEDTAMKALVASRAGNFDMLQRYLPALRTANTESEKAQIVNDFLNKSYQVSKDRLGTTAGAWEALKGRIGDAWEEMGAAIMQSNGLHEALNRMGESVRKFGGAVREWITGGGIEDFIGNARKLAENVIHQWNMIKLHFGTAMAVIGDAFNTVVNYIKNNAAALKNSVVATFKYMADVAAEVWQKIKHPIAHDFEMPSTQPIQDAYAEMARAAKGEGAKTTALQDAANRLKEEEYNRHGAEMKRIDAETKDAINRRLNRHIEDMEKGNEVLFADAEKGAEQIAIASENAAQKEVDAQKAALSKKEAMVNREIDLLKKKLDEQKRIAALTVKAFLEEQQAKEDAAKSANAEVEKADRLKKKLERGTKLSKRDAKWLEAFNEIGKQQVAARAGALALQDKERRLEKLQADQKRILENIDKNLTQNLEFNE